MQNTLTISSNDFDPDGPIPDRLARDHGEETPSLQLGGAPEGTLELAVFCHDPDAPRPRGFVHWAVYGIPPETTELNGTNADQFRVGPNSWGEASWGGMKPLPGHGTHRYYFWVYAVSTPVQGTPSYQEFLDAHGGDIVGQERVVGTYEVD